MKPLEITLLDSAGEHQTKMFSTEDAVVAYLKETYTTEAPVAFQYEDGSPLATQVLDRIFDQVFAA